MLLPFLLIASLVDRNLGNVNPEDMLDALETDHPKALEMLRGAGSYARDEPKLLHFAAQKGLAKTAAHLIKAGADPAAQMERFGSALHTVGTAV